MIKNIIGALAAIGFAASPVLATTDFTTQDLLDVLENGGVSITVNSDTCDSTFYGRYEWSGMRRRIHLCPGDSVDPIDHSTVRHETWHAVQHCVNVLRGTNDRDPVHEDQAKLITMVNNIVPANEIAYIKAQYPQEQWLSEFEATAAEHALTAEEIADNFIDVCVSLD